MVILQDEVLIFLSLALKCLFPPVYVGWEITLIHSKIISHPFIYDKSEAVGNVSLWRSDHPHIINMGEQHLKFQFFNSFSLCTVLLQQNVVGGAEID